MSQLVWRPLKEEAMDPQESYFVGQLRSLVAPTPSSAAFPSSEETARHPELVTCIYNSSAARDGGSYKSVVAGVSRAS